MNAIMGDMLIRNVPEVTVARLKARAKRHGRSLQAEALAALQAEGPYSGTALLKELHRLREQGQWDFDVEAALAALREDRAR
jgi:plasmid stability protein